jgi:hypothetical protein
MGTLINGASATLTITTVNATGSYANTGYYCVVKLIN